MGNNKPNILVIAGGVLCLVSMLLGYVEFNAIVIKVPISWGNVARFVNNLLYAVPVVGLLMLLAGVVGNQAFQSVSAVAAVILCVWYLFVHRDILQGDAIRMLMGANTMLSQLIEGQGLTMEDISKGAQVLSFFLRLSWGYILLAVGTALNVVGIFFNPAAGGSSVKRVVSSYDESSDSNDYDRY